MGWRLRAVVTVVVSFGLASAVAELFRGVGAAEVRVVRYPASGCETAEVVG